MAAAVSRDTAEKAKNDKVILSYHDSIIRESDISLLQGPHWLNDTLIGFYLEYLEKEVYSESNVAFIRPEIIQCLKFSAVSEFDIFLEPLNTKSKLYAVMPLNDCNLACSAGGSHWSLLVFSSPERTLYHIDSSVGSNDKQARKMYDKICLYLKDSNISYQTLPSTQQSNSYDCGVFVLCNIELILKNIARNKSVSGVDLHKNSRAVVMRNELKELIENLSSQDANN